MPRQTTYTTPHQIMPHMINEGYEREKYGNEGAGGKAEGQGEGGASGTSPMPHAPTLIAVGGPRLKKTTMPCAAQKRVIQRRLVNIVYPTVRIRRGHYR